MSELLAARARLQARQDALVSALVTGVEPTEPIDPAVLARARRVIADKRAWVAERRARHTAERPSLARRLASAWRRLFGR
jgi:hypothetical protein